MSFYSPLYEQSEPLNDGDQVAVLIHGQWPSFGTVCGIVENSCEKSCDSAGVPAPACPNDAEEQYEVYTGGNANGTNNTEIYKRSQLCLVDRHLKIGSWANVLPPFIDNNLVDLDERFSEETLVIVRNKKVYVTLQMLGNPYIIFVDVPSTRFEPVSRFLQGDIVTCNTWIGKVLGVHRKIILHHLESNKTYKIEEDLLLGSILQNKISQFQLHEGQTLKLIPFDIKSPFIDESFEKMELLSGCIVKHIVLMSMDVDWRDRLSPEAEAGNSKPPMKIERESGYIVDRLNEFDKSIGIGEKFLMTPDPEDFVVKVEDFYKNWNDGFEKRADLRYPFQPERMFLRSFRVVCTRTILECILMNGKTFKLDTKKIIPSDCSIHQTPLPNAIMTKSYDENHEKICQILFARCDGMAKVMWQDNTIADDPLENEESYFSLSHSKYNYSPGTIVKFNSVRNSTPKFTFGYFLYPSTTFRCLVKDPKSKIGEIHKIKNIQVIDMGEEDAKIQNGLVNSHEFELGYDSEWEVDDFSKIFPNPFINGQVSEVVPDGIARAVASKPLPMDFDGILKSVLVDAIKELVQISPEVGTFHCYLERIDIISFVIFGTLDTVYEHFLFIFDVWIPDKFPETEPEFYYRSFSKKQWPLSPMIDTNTGRLDISYLNWNSKSSLMDVVTYIREYVFCKNPILLYGSCYEEDADHSRDFNEEAYLHLVDSSLKQILSPSISLLPFDKIFESYINDNIETQFMRLNKWTEIGNLNLDPAELQEIYNLPIDIGSLTQFPLLPLSRGAVITLGEIINKCAEIRHLDLNTLNLEPEFEYDDEDEGEEYEYEENDDFQL